MAFNQLLLVSWSSEYNWKKNYFLLSIPACLYTQYGHQGAWPKQIFYYSVTMVTTMYMSPSVLKFGV
jgi:hypothetical protein